MENGPEALGSMLSPGQAVPPPSSLEALTSHCRELPLDIEDLAYRYEDLITYQLVALPSERNDDRPIEDRLAGMFAAPSDVVEPSLRLPEGQEGIFGSPRLKSALKFAVEAHQSQRRKGNLNPYVTHPILTAWIASNWTQDEATLAACLLHDVLEDCQDKYGGIKGVEQAVISAFGDTPEDQQFGWEVLGIVRGASKDPSLEHKKQAYVHNIEETVDPRQLIVIASDKTHNISCTDRDSRNNPDFWGLFKNGEEGRRQWYSKVISALQGRVGGGSPVVTTLIRIYQKVFLRPSVIVR